MEITTSHIFNFLEYNIGLLCRISINGLSRLIAVSYLPVLVVVYYISLTDICVKLHCFMLLLN